MTELSIPSIPSNISSICLPLSKWASLSFISDRHDLAVWSEVFDRHRGLAFRGGAAPTVAYRLRSGEDAARKALAIMRSYDEVRCEDKKNENEGK